MLSAHAFPFPLSVSFADSSPLWGSQGNLINCPLLNGTRSTISLPTEDDTFRYYLPPYTYVGPGSMMLHPLPLIHFLLP